MALFLTCLTLILLFNVNLSEYCIQGEDEGCKFECHCAKKSECRGGRCSNGCQQAALGYNWGGPACQIGNVGLHKEANMTASDYFNKLYPPTGALDGQIVLNGFNSNCAHPYNSASKPAEWWADLGNIYIIYNITIFGRTDCCQHRLEKFDLTVYNTPDNEHLCAYHENTIREKATINCNKPVKGRYVHFKRKGGSEINLSGLCEVIIIGHRIYDCSNCSSNDLCDDVTGCQLCRGSYQPECKPECKPGSYGINCNERCGYCKTNNTCDKVNGHCLDGCQLWWTDDKCKTYIDKPTHGNETIEVLYASSNYMKIKWQKLNSLSLNLSQFYGYVVTYKESNRANYADFASRAHQSSSDTFIVDVTTLTFNTRYDIKVTPYREINGKRDLGSSYETLHERTTCIAPEKPLILNITVSNLGQPQIPNITVIYQSKVDLIPNCQEISNISLKYEVTEDGNFSQVALSLTDNAYTIIPNTEGRYEIWVTATNNEGYSSDSEMYTVEINVQELDEPESSKSLVIIASTSVMIILVVIISAVVAVVVFWKRRRSSTTDQQFVNEAFTKDEVKNKSESRRQTLVPPEEDLFNDITQKAFQSSKNNSMADVSVSEEEIKPEEDEPIQAEECLYANSAINVVNFEGYVEKRMAQIKTLSTEYDELPAPDMSRCLTAKRDENKDRNRFRKIYPYDETRVLLEGTSNNNDDYINATYITGFNKQKEYIATQGPKPNTLIDFWHMVWQENSNRIVMVANVLELGKKKVEPYWCEKVGKSRIIGDFNVKTESLKTSADYDIRVVTVNKGDQYRTIRHFHFKTWEDKDKPQYGPHTLLAFMERVHYFDKHAQGPLIVHCSAGVGRTGTFIALDILQQMAVKNKTVDIYNCVDRLRRERMMMVQTKEQYIFLHKAVVEFIKHMNTSHNCNRFTQKFASVCDPQPDPEIMSSLKKELKHILALKQATGNQDKGGLTDENKNKNRNVGVIPDDSQRLFISGSHGNYINAVAVDSFAVHDSKIVTQMPLPHTMGDFWKLVMEQNCQAVIMLNELQDHDANCGPYWPEEIGSKKCYDEVEVELLATDVDTEFIIIRDFRLKLIKKKSFAPPEVMTIKQFQLLSWPDKHKLPAQRKHLFDLMDQLQRWQQHQKIPLKEWKILVHCIDGGIRSRMFCGASFMLDRMKAEQDVNVSLSVRSVRRTRPQFFNSMVEYQFLYQMAVERLTESSEYVNTV